MRGTDESASPQMETVVRSCLALACRPWLRMLGGTRVGLRLGSDDRGSIEQVVVRATRTAWQC